jgi:hypothetical protein
MGTSKAGRQRVQDRATWTTCIVRGVAAALHVRIADRLENTDASTASTRKPAS